MKREGTGAGTAQATCKEGPETHSLVQRAAREPAEGCEGAKGENHANSGRVLNYRGPREGFEPESNVAWAEWKTDQK